MLKQFEVRFSGRNKGATGRTFMMSRSIEGETFEKAQIKMYDKYQDISIYSFKEIKEAV